MPLTSALIWALIIGISALFYPIAVVIRVVTGPFDRRLAILHRFTCFWAALFSWGNPVWPTTVVGRERVDPKQPYVIVANHLSILDIVVLFRLFIHFKWVSKVENFSLPFIGWNMTLNRYIPLKRGDRESVLEMLALCRKALAEGSSIFMFPEGTRSDTGELRPFKPGAFQVALDAKVPILPVVVEGNGPRPPQEGPHPARPPPGHDHGARPDPLRVLRERIPGSHRLPDARSHRQQHRPQGEVDFRNAPGIDSRVGGGRTRCGEGLGARRR